MTTTTPFLVRCERYRARRGIARTYLSRILFDDGKTLDALVASRAGVTVRRLARAEVLLGEFERALARTISEESDAVEAA